MFLTWGLSVRKYLLEMSEKKIFYFKKIFFFQLCYFYFMLSLHRIMNPVPAVEMEFFDDGE